MSAPGRLETVFVTASAAGFLNGWIDFNRNGDLRHDRAALHRQGGRRRRQPADLHRAHRARRSSPGRAIARFRLTSAAGQATSPVGTAPNGEVEDYARTLFDPAAAALSQCPVGSQPQQVSIIQNPSFETRTQDFVNSSAELDQLREELVRLPPHRRPVPRVPPPTFDSGPAASSMPFRAGADGYGFLGGHTTQIAGDNDVG